LNNRPLTAVSDHPDDLSTLTPVSILTGCVASSFPPDVLVRADGYRSSWRAVQWMANQFWKRWKREYLLLLQQRPKWLQPFRNLWAGDIVLMVEEDSKRGSWPKAIVTATFPDSDDVVRRVRVKTVASTYVRDVRKLCLLEASD